LDFEFVVFEDIITESQIEVLYSSVDFCIRPSDITQINGVHSE